VEEIQAQIEGLRERLRRVVPEKAALREKAMTNSGIVIEK
jgi:hypothetical protein